MTSYPLSSSLLTWHVIPYTTNDSHFHNVYNICGHSLWCSDNQRQRLLNPVQDFYNATFLPHKCQKVFEGATQGVAARLCYVCQTKFPIEKKVVIFAAKRFSVLCYNCSDFQTAFLWADILYGNVIVFWRTRTYRKSVVFIIFGNTFVYQNFRKRKFKKGDQRTTEHAKITTIATVCHSNLAIVAQVTFTTCG